MKLNLREIIEIPGARIPFETDVDVSRLDYPSVVRYLKTPRVVREVRNEAGVLHITGTLSADMLCVCDRCGAQFESEKQLELHAVAVTEEEPDDPEAFEIVGDALDLDEVLETAFVLDMETKFLCSEDCKGICPNCGKNLNEGPCACRVKSDPRLAVLEQLLDDKE